MRRYGLTKGMQTESNEYKPVSCPHCKKKINPLPDPDFDCDYQPTASDSDAQYIDTEQTITCPHCQLDSEVYWRYWLTDEVWQPGNKISRRKIVPLPPNSHPWLSAFQFSFSPDSSRLYISTFKNKWYIQRLEGQWHFGGIAPERPMLWYSDGSAYFFISENSGKYFFANMYNAETHGQKRHLTYKNLKDTLLGNITGWTLKDNRYLLIIRKDRYDCNKSTLTQYDFSSRLWSDCTLPHGNGGTNAAWFNSSGTRVLCSNCDTYDGDRLTVYTVDHKPSLSISPVGDVREKDFYLLQPVWIGDTTLLVLYYNNPSGLASCPTLPLGLIWYDCTEQIVKTRHIDRFPDEVITPDPVIRGDYKCGSYDMKPNGFFPWPGLSGRFILVSNTIHVICITDTGIEYLGPLDTQVFPVLQTYWDGHYVVAISPDTALLAASFKDKTILYDLEKRQVVVDAADCLKEKDPG